MLHSKTQGALAILCTTMLAGTLLLGGCGRTPVEPGGVEEPGVEEPAPGEDDEETPGYPDDPFEPGEPGGGYEPAPAPGTGGGVAPKPPASGGSSALRPLPAATPTPAPRGNAGGGGADPAAAMDKFIDTLRSFGYEPANSSNAAYNVRMQLLPLTRVPDNRFHWVNSDTLGLTWGRRKATFPTPPASMKAWMDGGLNLARRAETVSWYVARRELYRDIFRDRYAQDPAGSELIFYKRLNKTGFMVSYRANGQIDDYAFFPEINWREFLAVPDAFLR
ncbi:MAG: hypothetical protein ACK46X_21440 [Candidatus Sericytochromatia bacterium]